MHVQAAIEGIEFSVEDDLCERFAGEDLSWRNHERAEQLELDVGEIESDAAAEGGAGAGVEFDSGDGEVANGGGLGGSAFARCGNSGGAAKNGADAGEQLAGIEGLGEVVVGSDFEADDAVNIFAARGEEDDADLGGCAQAAQHLEAIEAGQHDIEQDDGEVAGEGAMQTELAVMLGGDGKAVTREIVLDHGGKFSVVVDEENRFHVDSWQGKPQLCLYSAGRVSAVMICNMRGMCLYISLRIVTDGDGIRMGRVV